MKRILSVRATEATTLVVEATEYTTLESIYFGTVSGRFFWFGLMCSSFSTSLR